MKPIAIEPDGRRAKRLRLTAVLTWIWKLYTRALRMFASTFVATAMFCLADFFINYVVLSTAQSRAYRDLDPSVPECQQGLAKGWPILTEVGRERLRTSMDADDGGWVDPSNEERAVVAQDRKWETRLRCALQRHIVPATTPYAKPLDYILGFLEFQEDG